MREQMMEDTDNFMDRYFKYTPLSKLSVFYGFFQIDFWKYWRIWKLKNDGIASTLGTTLHNVSFANGFSYISQASLKQIQSYHIWGTIIS